jgi:oxygen-dependent protoporphyrinogen oxidase
MSIDKVIIGAGFSGLLHGLSAIRAGQQVLILERNQTPGGLIQSEEIDGIKFDSGAEAFSNVTPEFENWLSDLGLDSFVVKPNTKSPVIVSKIGVHAIPQGVFGVPVSLDDSGLEFLGAPALALARKLDAKPLPENLDDLSVRELIDLRLGAAFTNSLVGPVISGVHGSLPEHLEARSVLGGLVKELKAKGSIVEAAKALRGDKPAPGSAVASFEGGMHLLIEKLVHEFVHSGGTLRLGSDVTRVSKLSDGQFEIEAGETIRARDLVIATTANAAARMLVEYHELSIALQEIESLETLLVTVLVESPELNSFPIGTGALVAEDLGLAVKATTHLNAKWEWLNGKLKKDQHLVRFSFRNSMKLDGIEQHSAILEGFDLIYGVKSPKLLGQVEVLWEDSLVKASAGHLRRIERIKSLVEPLGIELRGAYMSGNGLLGILKHELVTREGDLIGTGI